MESELASLRQYDMGTARRIHKINNCDVQADATDGFRGLTWIPTLLFLIYVTCSSVQFRRSVVSDSLPPHESQHARPPCPSPTPRVHSNSCPSSWWCHPAILSSAVPFSCPQSFTASGSFPMSQFFVSGGKASSTGISASTSVLPRTPRTDHL